MHKTLTIAMLLLLTGWLLGGCSNDETAPNDPLPELSEEDVAQQAGYMSMGLVEVAPIAVEFSGKADALDGRYQYTFEDDDMSGTVELYFSYVSEPSGFDNADHAQTWTTGDAPLVLTPFPDGESWLLVFSLESDIIQAEGTADVYGSGTLTVGGDEATFDVEALAVEEGEAWPASGYFVFRNQGIAATVTFDGDSTATVAVEDMVWTLNLEDGELTAR